MRFDHCDLPGPRENMPGMAPQGSSFGPIQAIAARMRGPGGYYNAGNLLALAAGVTAQILTATGGTGQAAGNAIWVYFFGSPGASWLTLAVIIFLISGEVYHRAWLTPAAPIQRLNRLGDFLSGIGASALTVSLVFYGNIVLALASGAILAGAKFGNVLFQGGSGSSRLASGFRAAALFSRAPALAALASQLAVAAGSGGLLAEPVLMAIVMITCTLIWCWADYLLLRAG